MKRAKHIKMTERQFRQRKRREFNQLIKGIKNSRIKSGAAYLPKEAFAKLHAGFTLIEEAHKICRKWWKNS